MTGLPGLLVASSASALVLLVVGSAGAIVTRPLWRLPVLAPAGALLGLGAAGTAVFHVYVLSAAAGRLTAIALLVGSCLVCARSADRLDAAGRARIRRTLPWASLAVGAALVVTGALTLWEHSGTWFDLARTRFLNPLPDDNEIPARVAAALAAGDDPRAAPGGDWQSSDRPPLQTGLLLLVQATTGWTGLPAPTTYFTTGLALQLTWLPAAASFLRVLGVRPRAAALGVLFNALSGTVVVNTAFTWPKLLSAALVVASLAVLLGLPRQPRLVGPLAAAGALCAFAALAHGAAVFAAPVLVWAIWRVRRRTSPAAWGASAAALAVSYLPWLVYQRLYDPPGDRLLKWHLAGVEAPTGAPLGEVLARAYGDVPVAELLQNKLSNLGAPLSRWPWAGLGDVLVDPTERRISEFFVLSSTLGLGVALLLLLVGARVVSAVQGTRDDRLLQRATTVLGATGAALVFWAVVLYGPAATSVHQGSHVPVLLLLLVPSAWAAQRAWWPTVAVTVVQGALLLTVYARDGSGDTHLVPGAAALVGVGLACCIAGVATVHAGPSTPPRAAGGHPRAAPRAGWDETRVPPRRTSLPPVPGVAAGGATTSRPRHGPGERPGPRTT